TMMSPESNEQRLERTVHQTLRELPLRRAPLSLESRVLAEIQRRVLLPWWRKSFTHWPVAARAAFVVISGGFIKLAWTLSVWVMAGFGPAPLKDAVAQQFGW